MRWFACGFVVVFFVWSIAFFYMPGQGFTSLIQFGAMEHSRYLAEVKTASHYEMPRSPGYDSQWYVQIAMHPRLKDPVLRKAVDSLVYRARRILFIGTAWVLGGGNPARVMDVYAVQNIVCWFLLAVLLFRWFPPVNWGNVFRWAAVLFSFGLIFSVRGSLPDGPTLLLIAIGMALIESKRLWLGALVIGIAALGKDTGILGGMALPPADPRKPRTWFPWIARGALLIAPLAAWMVYLRLNLGHGDDIGPRNFALPFSGLVNKLEDTVSDLVAERYPFRSVAKFDLLVLAGLLAQFFFFALRIRWRDPWWRIGAAYAILMVFLGDAVWERYPSAAARVLLPMTLAFNVMVPRTRAWLLLLAIGNLGIFASVDLLRPPGRESFVVEGPRALLINPKTNGLVEVVYGPRNWYDAEKTRWEFWRLGRGFFRWSMGDSSLAVRNPHPFPLLVDINFGLRSADHRAAIVAMNGKEVWREMLEPAEVVSATIPGVVLPPGDTVLRFTSDRPAAFPGNGDYRRLTFSVRDLEIDLKERR